MDFNSLFLTAGSPPTFARATAWNSLLMFREALPVAAGETKTMQMHANKSMPIETLEESKCCGCKDGFQAFAMSRCQGQAEGIPTTVATASAPTDHCHHC